MSLKSFLFVTVLLIATQSSFSQRNYQEYNLLGLYGGLTLFDIDTDNFNTQQGSGLTVGFVTRGDVYNNWDLEYGVSFQQNEVGIFGRDLTNPTNNFDEQYINYTLQSAQIKLLAGYNIIRHHLTVDFGPILNVNGKMNLDSERFENFILDGYSTLKASDIENISRVHFHLAGGVTAGLENVRLNAQYQYGVTNLFNRFNDTEALTSQNPEGEFKGTTSTIVLGAYIFF